MRFADLSLLALLEAAVAEPSLSPPPASPPPPTPPPVDDDDVDMQDAPEQQSSPATPDVQADQDEEDKPPSPAADEEPEFIVQKDPSLDPPSPPIEVPKKRRIGRPPKYPRPERDQPGYHSEGTPQKRKRGRPPGAGWRGRGGRGAQPFQSTKVKIDKEGTMADVADDEVVITPDPAGETKVDKDGNLLGGREYRVRTFTILNRKNRLYMLSTEPARCCGFRDSYLFFTKHLQLYKVIIDDDEKRDLIERDVIPHSYKGRSIGVVTARSVFREFGARIVVGGRKVIDDYKEFEARARGDVEGDVADPHDRLPPSGQPYNRNQYVAWHGASAVYHTNLPNIPIQNGKPLPGKRRVQITSANWQFEHARAARLVQNFFFFRSI
jgi:chromatin structure-remodeling complex protein RSC7